MKKENIPTTKQYESLSVLGRCLLLYLALGTKESNTNRFVSFIKHIIFHLPPDVKKTHKFVNIDFKSEFLILKSFGWINYKSRLNNITLAAHLDDFQILYLIYQRDSTLFKSVFPHVSNHYSAIYWNRYNEDNNDAYIIRNLKVSLITDDLSLYTRSVNNTAHKINYSQDESLQKNYDAFHQQLLDTSEDGYFQYLGENIAGYILKDVLLKSIMSMENVDDIFPRAQAVLEQASKASNEKVFNRIFNHLALLLIFKGAFKTIARLIERYDKTPIAAVYKGLLCLLIGSYPQAESAFNIAYKTTPENKKYYHFPKYFANIFYFVSRARYLGQHYELLAYSIDHFAQNKSEFLSIEQELMSLIHNFAQNRLPIARNQYKTLSATTPLDALFLAWCAYWIETKPSKALLKHLDKIYTTSKDNNFKWLQFESATLLAHFSDKSTSIYQKDAETLSTKLGIVSLLHLMPKIDKWERTLTGLEGVLNLSKTDDSSVNKTQNLVFHLNLDQKTPVLEIKIQAIAKKGGWTSGRKAKLYDLKNYAKEFGTTQEKKIIESFSDYSLGDNRTHYSDFYYDSNYVFKKMVGLSNLYHHKNTNVSLELVAEAPKVVIEELDDHFNVQANHLPYKEGVNFYKTSPTTYKIVDFSEQQFQMLCFFSAEKVVFPKNVSQRLTDVITQLKEVVNVESLLASDVGDLEIVPASTTPHIHLLPVGKAFQMELFVKPHEASLQYFRAGEGRQILLDTIDGKEVRIERDLKTEEKNAKSILRFLKPPKKTKVAEHIWALEEPENCLKVLSALHPLRAEKKVVVEWPKGEKFKLLGNINADQLALRISQGKDYWFSLNGEIRVDENLVFSLQKLMELSENSHNGYIEISDGQFLSLTKKFQKQLDTARGVLQKSKGNELQFHNLAGIALDDLLSEASEVQTDEYWEEQQQKLTKAKKIRPKVSKQFKASLRPYQNDGYKWMMQLAEWGVGCCLADDMGLGKTIQGLALLVARQAKGPALVVAPASVCRNWLRETEKFAPSLNPILLGISEREKIIKGLKKKDLLIVSYGLLYTQAALLKEVAFDTIILDEAQAIKNYATKRFKAAIQLNGAFKIAMTGTPVENHLGELWSQFQFINPGLLGTKQQFAQRFGVPIKNGEKDKMEQLKTLVQPFILRRKKSAVLKDLPPKTEIIYNVEMPDDERAFYEAARRNALLKLENDLDEQKAGTQHLMILAEITKMRRACCHPSLIDKKTALPGAKLDAFKEILSDLKQNGHRALVFSQFVDYLKIVENHLQKEQISYQYLDGSTPLKKRELAVNAFQEGEGDLFLISLKAGGVGLNLTAADYVIILDPWWNPAVEDQAADRAHRIGQQKPVTVYRLVIENTIEEKIVQLHNQKRDLADSLLQGADSSTKITAKDLLKILKNER